MKTLEQLDGWIGGKVRSWSARLSGGTRSPELLEVRRELLNDLRNQIQPLGDQRFVFPYPTVQVHLAAGSETHRQVLESAFAQDDDLKNDYLSLLSEADCKVPDGFGVKVIVVDDPELAVLARPFRVVYSEARLSTPVPPGSARRTAKLTVLRGEADPQEYIIQSDRTYLGRLQEVLSETGALRRRNDIAFAESETTVSREHAFITYHQETGAYRLHDSRNQRGTSVFRESRELRVPRGSLQGLDLHSGDEIHLGQARLRFETQD